MSIRLKVGKRWSPPKNNSRAAPEKQRSNDQSLCWQTATWINSRCCCSSDDIESSTAATLPRSPDRCALRPPSPRSASTFFPKTKLKCLNHPPFSRKENLLGHSFSVQGRRILSPRWHVPRQRDFISRFKHFNYSGFNAATAAANAAVCGCVCEFVLMRVCVNDLTRRALRTSP